MSNGRTISLAAVDEVNERVGRAKATADLLATYFESVPESQAQLMDDTIGCALNSIITELEAICAAVDAREQQ